MTELLTRKRPSKKSGTSVLGLAFEAGRLEVVDLRRTNGSVEIRKRLQAPLSLNLLTDEPELVGREIRQRLDAAGIRERRCVVCLPLPWAMTVFVNLPNLPDADQLGVLEIEAERGFPYSPDELQVSLSRLQSPTGEAYGTVVAVHRDHVARMEAILRAAQLRPLAFSLGLPMLQPPDAEDSQGVLTLTVDTAGMGIQLTAGGGIAVLRAVAADPEAGTAGSSARLDLLAREIRITLAQLPPGIQSAVRRARLFGGDEAREVLDRLGTVLRPLGLDLDFVRDVQPGDLALKVPAGTAPGAALSLATRWLAGRPASLEFLPPRLSPWQRFAERHASRKVALAGMAAAAAAVLIAGAFLVQQLQLNHWQSRWNVIRTEVAELDTLQQQLKIRRPWFDKSFRSLSVLRALAQAFPEDGSVAAKSVEIRGASAVTCTGTARDNQSLLRALDKLRALPTIREVNVDQIRGRSPVQYSFHFQWAEGGKP